MSLVALGLIYTVTRLDSFFRFYTVYGSSSCNFVQITYNESPAILEFQSGETIAEVYVYQDTDALYTNSKCIVGLSIATNQGRYYGVYGKITTTNFSLVGKDLLYFYGRAAFYVDAAGAQFGKC